MQNKKFMALIAVLGMLTGIITGCSEKKDGLTIGIAKIVQHDALDQVEQGIIDAVTDAGFNAQFDLQNANGDVNTAAQIAAKYKTEKVDVAVGIATPVAVALATAIKDTPVVFATITDPVGAGLVDSLDKGKGNVTGLSDAIPIKEHLKIFHSIYPFKKLGFIYSSAEKNSVTMYNQTKDACKEMGIELLPVTIYNPSEVNMAAESLSGKVDAFYVVTDNTLVSGITALISAAKAAKTPIFSEDYISAENGGILYAIGFDYYKAGRKTGKMAAEILKGKKPADMPVTFMDYPEESLMVVDMDRAKALNIAIPENLITKNTKIIENRK